MKKLPIYEVQMEGDDVGIYTISLVYSPAVDVEWMTFSKEEEKEDEPIKCSVVGDGSEHKVMAVVCRADYPIYRRNDRGEEFYVRFSAETIAKIAERFLRNGYQNAVNVEHIENSYIDGVNMEQFFIKNSAMGINPKGFENVADGSLFAVYHINNEAVWEAVKAGQFTGVSLEGYFSYSTENKELRTVAELLDYLRNIGK